MANVGGEGRPCGAGSGSWLTFAAGSLGTVAWRIARAIECSRPCDGSVTGDAGRPQEMFGSRRHALFSGRGFGGLLVC